jgi:hypothetical protein
MFHAQIPQEYWPDIFESVTFVIDRLPSVALSSNTPCQVLFSNSPDYIFFKVLGCACFPYTRPYVSNKFTPGFTPCVFLGYSSVYKGYKCLNLTTNEIYISKHVIFDETSFSFKQAFLFFFFFQLTIINTITMPSFSNNFIILSF